jgi:hypothetical protein
MIGRQVQTIQPIQNNMQGSNLGTGSTGPVYNSATNLNNVGGFNNNNYNTGNINNSNVGFNNTGINQSQVSISGPPQSQDPEQLRRIRE